MGGRFFSRPPLTLVRHEIAAYEARTAIHRPRQRVHFAVVNFPRFNQRGTRFGFGSGIIADLDPGKAWQPPNKKAASVNFCTHLLCIILHSATASQRVSPVFS